MRNIVKHHIFQWLIDECVAYFAIVPRSGSSSCRSHRTASQQCCYPWGKSLSSRIVEDQFSSPRPWVSSPWQQHWHNRTRDKTKASDKAVAGNVTHTNCCMWPWFNSVANLVKIYCEIKTTQIKNRNFSVNQNTLTSFENYKTKIWWCTNS